MMERLIYPKKITSVSSYIKAVFDLRSLKVSESSLSSYWFFRGQKNSLWRISPNVFRNDILQYEFDSIETAIRQRPYDFRECSTDFEILTKLQHYGLGTKLLDVTLNPLVALYFASEKNEQFVRGKDGRGKYVPSDGKIVYQYTYGHKVTELYVRIACALPFIEFSERFTLDKLCNKMLVRGVINSDEYRSLKKNDYKKFIESVQGNSFVISSYSNERLARQSGAFVVPSAIKIMDKNIKDGKCLVRKSRRDLDDIFEKSYFIIPANKKEKIREELDFLNINEATLFPELEHQLFYLQNRKLPEPGQVEDYEDFFRDTISYIDANQAMEEIANFKNEPHPDIQHIIDKYLAGNPELANEVIHILQEGLTIIDWWRKESVKSQINRDITHALQGEMSINESKNMANNIIKEVFFTENRGALSEGEK